MMSSVFAGNNIDEWKKHFRISSAIGDVLSRLGVVNVNDLYFVFEDDDGDILPQIQAVCTAIEFARFKKARTFTNLSLEAALLAFHHTAPSGPACTSPKAPLSISRKLRGEERDDNVEDASKKKMKIKSEEDISPFKGMREMFLDPSAPNFSSIRSEEAINFELILPETLHALTSAEDDCGIIRENAGERMFVKVAPRPFAIGDSRAAFYAQKIQGLATYHEIIKELFCISRSQLTATKCESFLACQRAAIFLSKEFNKVKPTDCATVHFCNVSVIQIIEREGKPFMFLENQSNGTFEKYNSNSGYCAPSPTDLGTNHDAVQAFSHWTHHITGGYCMVVDCQGVHSSNFFALTNPSVHCRNVLRFGKTNMGTIGMDHFFKRHVCNGVCAALSLPSK